MSTMNFIVVGCRSIAELLYILWTTDQPEITRQWAARHELQVDIDELARSDRSGTDSWHVNLD